MALRFNVPPNWPEPPAGWVPQPGWQPDPAWGPAPEGWSFWIDESEDEATRLLAESSPVAAEPEPSGSVAQPAGAGEDPDKTKALPYQQVADTLSAHVSQTSEQESLGAETTPPTEAFSQESFSRQGHDSAGSQPAWQAASSQPAGTAYAGAAGATPSYNLNGANNNYQQAGNYQPNYQNPYAPAGEVKKKNFFTTTAGILTIIGIVLLVLIVAAIFAVGMFFRSFTQEISSGGSSNSDSYSWQADSDSGESPDLSQADSGSLSGEVTEYKGQGDGLLDVSSYSDASDPAWVEFEYVPGDSNYDSVIFQGVDAKGSSSDVFVLSGRSGGETVKGSFWMNAKDYYEKTQAITVDGGEGSWTVKVHPFADAPSYGKGDKISGLTYSAFLYKGGESTVKVKFDSPQDDSDDFTLDAYDSSAKIFDNLAYGEGANYEASKSINYSEQTMMSMENSFQGSWEISFE